MVNRLVRRTCIMSIADLHGIAPTENRVGALTATFKHHILLTVLMLLAVVVKLVLIVLISCLNLILKVFHSIGDSDAEPGPQNAEKTAVSNDENDEYEDIVMADVLVHDAIDFLCEGAVVVDFLPDHDEHIAIFGAIFEGHSLRDARLHQVVLG